VTWPPHITVAAIVHRNGKFLMVEEKVNGETVLNQPAGHVEPGETIIDAMLRETMEETGWQVSPACISGIYYYQAAAITYHRLTFVAEPVCQVTTELDTDIIACHWLSLEELDNWQLRSPVVMTCINDYLIGQQAPLSILTHM
jgi:8-oxo-dGTP pyrophosphatase MutT (NUDIX family)